MKIRKAVKEGVLPRKKVGKLLDEALKNKVITQEEFKLWQECELVRLDAIQVDDFDEKEYRSRDA